MKTAGASFPVLGRVVALLLRPLLIFFDVTLLGYLLLSLDDRRWGLDGYVTWLGDLFPVGGALGDQLEATLLLAAGATIVALVIGGLGAAVRSERFGARAANASIPLLALAGPGLAFLLLYWAGIRLDLLPASGAPSLSSDPAASIRHLILPSLAIGVPMGPAMATVMTRRAPYTEHWGLATAGFFLADRAESREGWRVGFPTGLLVLGLIVTEQIFERDGLTSGLVDDLGQLRGPAALDKLALIALGGAIIAVVVDLIGLRPHRPTEPTAAGVRLATHAAGNPSNRLLLVAGATAAAVVTAGIAGALVTPTASPDAPLANPLTDGHLLGTDAAGRDLLQLAAEGLGDSLVAALVPSLVAIALGFGLVILQRRLGTVGLVAPGAVVDALWWPLPILALFALVGLSDGGSLNQPIVLAAVTVGLVPTAFRAVQRERVDVGPGWWQRLAGLWSMLAGAAFLAYVVASMTALDATGRSLGAQLSGARPDLPTSAWAMFVPWLFVLLAVLAFCALGASLVHRGWRSSADALVGDDETRERTNPVIDLSDGVILADDPIDLRIEVPTADEFDDGPLLPNYGLQPGLPRPEPEPDEVFVVGEAIDGEGDDPAGRPVVTGRDDDNDPDHDGDDTDNDDEWADETQTEENPAARSRTRALRRRTGRVRGQRGRDETDDAPWWEGEDPIVSEEKVPAKTGTKRRRG